MPRAVLVFSILMVVLVLLSGCQSYQPPGENLWLAL